MQEICRIAFYSTVFVVSNPLLFSFLRVVNVVV